jgi:uncharacterized protein
MRHDHAAILREILAGYMLPVRGFHGVLHWARVFENGLRVAETNGGDRDVVALFALFHDSRRINECTDEGHGWRGGELALSLRGSLVHLDDAQFALLYDACRLHTDGHVTDDPTVAACWDADRLDLGRVGITPSANRLCTDAARHLLKWAHERATNDIVASETLKAWGFAE